jgi:hypothetical protein
MLVGGVLCRGHVEHGDIDLCGKKRLDRSFDAQHFGKRVLVADAHLKLAPPLPEHTLAARMRQLRRVHIDGARTIDLAEPQLKRGVAQRHRHRLIVAERLHRLLVDLARLGDAKALGGARNIQQIHARAIRLGHGGGGALVDRHRVPREAVRLLEIGVHHIEQRRVRLWRGGDRLLEQVARALELAAAVARDKLAQVRRKCRAQTET